MSCKQCEAEIGLPYVICTICGLSKKPIGRDAFLQHLCDHECPGYRDDPCPGVLWPGEAKTLTVTT